MTSVGRPKVIFFGRPDSTDIALLGIAMEGSGVTRCTIRLVFFDESSAIHLIDLSATRVIESSEEQRVDTISANALYAKPMRDLISTYFKAIESALGLDDDKLWITSEGRAFAGYAPVLSALGTIIAGTNNPLTVTNRLKNQSTYDAWDVVSAVLDELLNREMLKFQRILKDKITGDVPHNAYDANEQLSFLAQSILGANVSPTGGVEFTHSADSITYMGQVRTTLDDHPFAGKRIVANDVLESCVVAHAIVSDLSFGGRARSVFRRACRQPFLWRHIRKLLSAATEVRGEHVGYMLNSYWNDPVPREIAFQYPAQVRNLNESVARVEVVEREQTDRVTFCAALPITMYLMIRNCSISCFGSDIVVQGGTTDNDGGSSIFSFLENNRIVCKRITFRCSSISVSGSLYLDAEEVFVDEHTTISVDSDTELELSEAVQHSYPWCDVQSTLVQRTAETLLVALIQEFKRRLGTVTTIVLKEDYSVPDRDRYMRWSEPYGELFRQFIRALVDNGLATRSSLQASHELRCQIRFSVDWDELASACQGYDSSDQGIIDFLVYTRRYGLIQSENSE